MRERGHLFEHARVLDARGRWARPEAERAAAEAAVELALGGEYLRFLRLRAEGASAGRSRHAFSALQEMGYRHVASRHGGPEFIHRLPVTLAKGEVVVTASVPALLTQLFLGPMNLAPYDPAAAGGVTLAAGEKRTFEFTRHDGRDLVWSARGSGARPGVVRVVVS